MMGPLTLMKLLHCKQITKRGSSYRRKSQRIRIKTESENNEFEYEQSTCRVCLKHGDIPIYGCEDVSNDLSIFTGIEITLEDTLPKYLCDTCNALLEGAIVLRRTAQESEKLLRESIQNLSAETIDNSTSLIDSETGNIDSDEDDDNDDWYESYQSEKLHRKSSEELSDNEESRKRNRARLSEKDTTSLEELLQKFGEYKEAKVKFENVRPKTFHCKKCNMNFNTNEEYSAHRLSAEHDNLRKNCPICNNSYNAVYLKKHLALHKTDKPFMCDICGKKFAILGQFNRHRVTHFIDELPFKCSLCPYRGRFSENLKIHIRTHTNDKRYQCPQCPTRFFINKSNLSRHILTHKSDYDFKCNQCQRGFHRKRDLELHFKVDHSGIKDHVCNVCGKAFGFRKQMMKHQRKVHKRDKMRSGRTPLYMILESKKQNEDNGLADESTGKGVINESDNTHHQNMCGEVSTPLLH